MARTGIFRSCLGVQHLSTSLFPTTAQCPLLTHTKKESKLLFKNVGVRIKQVVAEEVAANHAKLYNAQST
jgi:hypothetical protein